MSCLSGSRAASPSLSDVGRLSYVFVVGFLLLSALYHTFTGISPEPCGISPAFRQNIESEHLEKRDSHNSALPQPPVRTSPFHRRSLAGGAPGVV